MVLRKEKLNILFVWICYHVKFACLIIFSTSKCCSCMDWRGGSKHEVGVAGCRGPGVRRDSGEKERKKKNPEHLLVWIFYEATLMKVSTFWVVGFLHAVRALDVWFSRSAACFTGETAARETEWFFVSVDTRWQVWFSVYVYYADIIVGFLILV